MKKTISERSHVVKGRTARLRVQEILDGRGVDLVDEILKLADEARKNGDLSIALNAYSKLLPYTYSKKRDDSGTYNDKRNGVTINLIDPKQAQALDNSSFIDVMNELETIKSE